MLTYTLFKIESMLWSATTRKGQPDADLPTVQNIRASSCKQQPGRVSQMLTYMLFKTQSMLLSATSRKGQPDADLLSIENPEHALVSNNQKGPVRC